MSGAHHVVLVGLMGVGKSTVGRRLGKRLDRPFVDTDELVEAKTGMRVREIFATQGEPTFRDLERGAVAEACASPQPLVIACGGGAVVDAGVRRVVRDAGTVVWLQAPVEELAARVGAAPGGTRPLLVAGDVTDTLTRLATLRADAYTAAAHVTIDTAGRSVDEVVDAVIEALP